MVMSRLLAAAVVLSTLAGAPAAIAGALGREGMAPSRRVLTDTAELRTTRDGFVFVDEEGDAVGQGTRRTYRLEVEPATGVDPWLFSDLAERILNNARGWTAAGDWRLQRVTSPNADIRVVLATPETVDRLCARAGLDTHGEVSCWNGRYAAINVDRWQTGAKGFVGSLRAYRQYVLNHEVGHGLGYGHKQCPERGARAPVMQQQTYATRPCVANGWPAVAH